MTVKTAIVLDSDQRSALAITRSLGQNGIRVINGEYRPRSLAGLSKFSKGHFTYPDPRANTELFLRAIESVVNDNKEALLLPVTDLTTNIVIGNRKRFGNAKIPYPEQEPFEELTDKISLASTAKKLGIRVPRGWSIVSVTQAREIAEVIGYPVVIKPPRSEFCLSGKWQRTQVKIASSPIELSQILEQSFASGITQILLQEFVPGHGAGIFALYNGGAPVGFFAHQRVREKPPSGGVSVVSESIAPDSVMLDWSRKLLESASWHGLAMVEYRVGQGGEIFLMEINGRPWGSIQLAISAGFDFPYLLSRVADGQSVSAPDVRTGIRNRWLLGDLDHLLLSFRDKYRSKQSGPGYIGLLKDFFNFDRATQEFEVFNFRDPLPFLLELGRYVKELIRQK
jgi:predicted ATP-grasp superfamily ATP-dependent carboligase